MFNKISIVRKCVLVLIVLFITETNQQNVVRRTIEIDEGNGRITKINIVKNGNDVVVTSVSNNKPEIPSILIPKLLPVAPPTKTAAVSNSNTVKTNSSRATVPNKSNDSVPSKISVSSSQSISSNKNTSNSISVSVNSNGRPVLPIKPIAPTPVESVNYPQGISLSVSSNNKALPLLVTIQNNTMKLVGNNPASKNGVVSVSSSSSSGKNSNQNGAISVSINKPRSVSASVSSKAKPPPKINSPIILDDILYSSEDDWNMD